MYTEICAEPGTAMEDASSAPNIQFSFILYLVLEVERYALCPAWPHYSVSTTRAKVTGVIGLKSRAKADADREI